MINTLPYILIPLSFTANGTSLYRGLLQRKGTVTQDNLITRMIKGTTLTRPDAVALLEAQTLSYAELLLEGYWINTPLVNFKLSMRGSFDSASDSFVPGRNLVVVTASPGSALRNLGESISVTKDERLKLNPNPIELLDPNNPEADNVLIPGKTGTLTGHRLTLDPTDPKQGIFLLAADGSETRIELYAKISPGELIFVVPTGLTPGEYELEVRTKIKDETKVRRGTLDQLVAVP